MSDALAPRPEEAAAAALLEAATPNGKAKDPFEAKLLADLDGAIREKRDGMIALEAERERVAEQLAEARSALKRYEDFRKRLLGEPLKVGRKPGRPPGSGPVRATPSKLSPEKLGEIEAFVLAYAETHEEFRQIDIRSAPGSPVTDSGKSSSAFEQMRQNGVVRLARAEGNNKWYRLTRAAHNAENLQLHKTVGK